MSKNRFDSVSSTMPMIRNAVQAYGEIALLGRLVHIAPGSRMLEVGCGVGNALPALARAFRPDHLVGMDRDAGAVAQARADVRVRQSADVIVAELESLPFPDGSFDVVVDFGTCYHVADPTAALRQITRVLRPGGLFLHETRAAQLLAHPVVAGRRPLPWGDAPGLVPGPHRGLWAVRRRVAVRVSPTSERELLAASPASRVRSRRAQPSAGGRAPA